MKLVCKHEYVHELTVGNFSQELPSSGMLAVEFDDSKSILHVFFLQITSRASSVVFRPVPVFSQGCFCFGSIPSVGSGC